MLSKKRESFVSLSGKLHALSPLAVLTRGYGAVYSGDGEKVITEARDVSVGDSVRLRMSDGEITALATDVTLSDDKNSNSEVRSDGR